MKVIALFAALLCTPVLAADAPPATPVPEAVKPFAPKFDYAFTITIELEPAKYLGVSPEGSERAAVMIKSGVITGPMLQGRVLPGSGGDWAQKRSDGTLDFDARYLLELSDGTLVYLQNVGFRWSSAETMAKLSRREDVPFNAYYMRVTPRFEVKTGPHDWLARHVFVGVAEKVPSGNRIHYFIMR